MPVFVLQTAILGSLSVSMLGDKFVLQNAFPTTVRLCKLLAHRQISTGYDGKRGEIPVAPVEFNVTAVLLALIVLWLVYSVMGWWTWA